MAILGPAEFKKYILKNRKEFIALSLKQERELGRLYLNAGSNIKSRLFGAREIDALAQRKVLDSVLLDAKELTRDFKGVLDKSLLEAANLGTDVSRAVVSKYSTQMAAGAFDVSRMFFKVPTDAVKMAYNRIWNDGLKLSDRVWLLNTKTKNELEKIVMEHLIRGTAASDKEMIARLSRLLNPGQTGAVTKLHGRNVSYEATRLLRTERHIAFRDAQVLSAEKNPGLIGIKWELSASHPDIACDCPDLASDDSGLGLGVYKPENLPMLPHPNCMCYTYEVNMSLDKFADMAADWTQGKNDFLDEYAKFVA